MHGIEMASHRAAGRAVGAVLAMILGVVGCDAGPTPSSDLRAAFDGQVRLAVDEAASVSGVIGRDGGELAVGSVSLTLPPGALAADTLITVTPISNIDGSPLDDGFIGGVQLQPHGLHFLRTVLLEVPLPDVVSGVVVGFGSGSDGAGFHLVPSVNGEATVSIPLWHFSAAGAVAADPTQIAQVLSYEPSPAHEAAEQAIAAATATAGDGGLDQGALIAALRSWYEGSVRPGLQVAMGASQEFFELAVGEWLAGWRASVAVSGLDDALAVEDQEAARLALDAAANLAGRVLGRCTPAGDVSDMLRDAARLANAVQLDPTIFQLETREADGRQLPSALDLLGSCLSVDVESMVHPATLAVAMDNPLQARVATVFWNGGPTYDRQIHAELVNGSPSEVVEDSDLITGGSWETTVNPSEPGSYRRTVRAFLAQGADEDLLRALGDSMSLSVPVRERLELTADGPGDADFVTEPAPVPTGDAVTFRVRLAGPDIGGRTLTYGLDGPGSLAQTSGTTSSSGLAAFTYMAPASGGGTPTVTVTFQDGTIGRSASIDLEIAEPGVTVELSDLVGVEACERIGSENARCSRRIGDGTLQWSGVAEIGDNADGVSGSSNASVGYSATGPDGATTAFSVDGVINSTVNGRSGVTEADIDFLGVFAVAEGGSVPFSLVVDIQFVGDGDLTDCSLMFAGSGVDWEHECTGSTPRHFEVQGTLGEGPYELVVDAYGSAVTDQDGPGSSVSRIQITVRMVFGNAAGAAAGA